MDFPNQQTTGFKIVNEADQSASVHVECASKSLLTNAVRSGHKPKDAGVRRGEPERLEKSSEFLRSSPANLRKQKSGPVRISLFLIHLLKSRLFRVSFTIVIVLNFHGNCPNPSPPVHANGSGSMPLRLFIVTVINDYHI
jgi:hypothetical protein